MIMGIGKTNAPMITKNDVLRLIPINTKLTINAAMLIATPRP